MRDSDLFTGHADRCRQEAADATLDNVRQRALRSQAAWSAMAARSIKTEAARAVRASRAAAEVAAAEDVVPHD